MRQQSASRRPGSRSLARAETGSWCGLTPIPREHAYQVGLCRCSQGDRCSPIGWHGRHKSMYYKGPVPSGRGYENGRCRIRPSARPKAQAPAQRRRYLGISDALPRMSRAQANRLCSSCCFTCSARAVLRPFRHWVLGPSAVSIAPHWLLMHLRAHFDLGCHMTQVPRWRTHLPW